MSGNTTNTFSINGTSVECDAVNNFDYLCKGVSDQVAQILQQNPDAVSGYTASQSGNSKDFNLNLDSQKMSREKILEQIESESSTTYETQESYTKADLQRDESIVESLGGIEVAGGVGIAGVLSLALLTKKGRNILAGIFNKFKGKTETPETPETLVTSEAPEKVQTTTENNTESTTSPETSETPETPEAPEEVQTTTENSTESTTSTVEKESMKKRITAGIRGIFKRKTKSKTETPKTPTNPEANKEAIESRDGIIAILALGTEKGREALAWMFDKIKEVDWKEVSSDIKNGINDLRKEYREKTRNIDNTKDKAIIALILGTKKGREVLAWIFNKIKGKTETPETPETPVTSEAPEEAQTTTGNSTESTTSPETSETPKATKNPTTKRTPEVQENNQLTEEEVKKILETNKDKITLIEMEQFEKEERKIKSTKNGKRYEYTRKGIKHTIFVSKADNTTTYTVKIDKDTKIIFKEEVNSNEIAVEIEQNGKKGNIKIENL